MKPPSTRLQLHSPVSKAVPSDLDERAAIDVAARARESIQPWIENDIEILTEILGELRKERVSLEERHHRFLEEERECWQSHQAEYERTRDRLSEASKQLDDSRRELDQMRQELREDVVQWRSEPRHVYVPSETGLDSPTALSDPPGELGYGEAGPDSAVAGPKDTSCDASRGDEAAYGSISEDSDASTLEATSMLERLGKGLADLDESHPTEPEVVAAYGSPVAAEIAPLPDTTGIEKVSDSLADEGADRTVHQPIHQGELSASTELRYQEPTQGIPKEVEDDSSLEDYLTQFTQRFGISEWAPSGSQGEIPLPKDEHETSQQTASDQAQATEDSAEEATGGSARLRAGEESPKESTPAKKPADLGRMRNLANLSSERVLMIHELRSFKTQAKNQLAFAAGAFLIGVTLMVARWALNAPDALVWIASAFFVGASVFLLSHLWCTKKAAEKRKELGEIVGEGFEEFVEEEELPPADLSSGSRKVTEFSEEPPAASGFSEGVSDS